jgi:hypothetical protein
MSDPKQDDESFWCCGCGGFRGMAPCEKGCDEPGYRGPPTSADKPPTPSLSWPWPCLVKANDPRNPSPPPTEEPKADPWALSDGFVMVAEEEDGSLIWAARTAIGSVYVYDNCADESVLAYTTVANVIRIQEALALRNRTDPPKTEEPR